jgi:hypothetical protein
METRETITLSGADLLWRAKGNAVLPVLERYADGSFRSELIATGDKRAREQVTAVRVVEYAVADPGRPGAETTRYRLLTTIADPAAAPADELAALYAQRWEIESAFDELKTHQAGPKVVLRSRTPDGVRQEAYGYLCVQYAIRALMHAAGDDAGVDPDRISFTRSLPWSARSGRSAPNCCPDGGCAPLLGSSNARWATTASSGPSIVPGHTRTSPSRRRSVSSPLPN